MNHAHILCLLPRTTASCVKILATTGKSTNKAYTYKTILNPINGILNPDTIAANVEYKLPIMKSKPVYNKNDAKDNLATLYGAELRIVNLIPEIKANISKTKNIAVYTDSYLVYKALLYNAPYILNWVAHKWLIKYPDKAAEV